MTFAWTSLIKLYDHLDSSVLSFQYYLEQPSQSWYFLAVIVCYVSANFTLYHIDPCCSTLS